MQASMCSRCGQNPAVVFITKIEGNQSKSQGLCLKCARELHIKPVDDILTKMGISDEDLENLSGEMMNALNGAEELMGMDPDAPESDDEDGKTATFPFFGKILDAFRAGPGGQIPGMPQNTLNQKQNPANPRQNPQAKLKLCLTQNMQPRKKIPK